jgi:hypothetical protein
LNGPQHSIAVIAEALQRFDKDSNVAQTLGSCDPVACWLRTIAVRHFAASFTSLDAATVLEAETVAYIR